MPFLILSAGRDTNLLNQRSAILRQAGYEVVIAGKSPDLVNRLFNGDFDLVLLCGSMRADERRRLTAIVKSHTPSTPVVLIEESEQLVQKAEEDEGILCRPEQVLDVVRDALSQALPNAA
jgi:CheY-like chemotaxis protein